MRCTLFSLHFLLVAQQLTGAWKCGVHETVCEVWLEISHRLTMMRDKTLIVAKDGRLYNYDEKVFIESNSINTSDVITCDGFSEPRIVIAINGTIPGPTIEVHEKQKVRVHIRNNMASETTSMHFHGQHQRGSPWMDGVSFVTQCPILPGHTFTHVFHADPEGTHWYHAHTGVQLSMGMYGAFIVHPESGPRPQYDKEHVLMVQEYNHDWDSTMGYMKMLYGMYVKGSREDETTNLSGARYSLFRFQAGLINGRGRYYDKIIKQHNGAPLEKFSVKRFQKYRFLLINAGTVYPFQISVDGHSLRVVATDGLEIEQIIADYVIIAPGERYDVELDATNNVNNYWIRAKTLQVGVNHTAEAILHYEGAPDSDPTSSARVCSSSAKCIAVNCPFSYFPDTANTVCVNLDNIYAKDKLPVEIGAGAKNIKEYFINFAFPGADYMPGSANGIQFAMPPVSALTQPFDFTTRCPGDGYRCEEDKICECSSVLDIHYGDVVQLVLTNMGKGKGWDHPIHLHGYSFWVVKVGYPKYNNITGAFIWENFDIDCKGNKDRSQSYCNHASWSKESGSSGGNSVPGLNIIQPLRKDTVNIPTGGYIVVRFQVNNPGLWVMHCHVELHVANGMMLMFNGSYSQIPPPPPDFPKCGNIIVNSSEANAQTATTKTADVECTENRKWKHFGIAIICIIAIIVISSIVYCIYKYRNSRMYHQQRRSGPYIGDLTDFGEDILYTQINMETLRNTPLKQIVEDSDYELRNTPLKQIVEDSDYELRNTPLKQIVEDSDYELRNTPLNQIVEDSECVVRPRLNIIHI